MIETPATTPAGTPVFPPGRYGHRRAPRRRQGWIRALVALAAVVAGLGLTLILHNRYGNGPYDTELVRFTDVTDKQVIVHFRVSLPAGKSAVCVVRARDRAGTEVGRATFSVPANPDRRPEVRYRLATSGRPVTGEIQGCRAASR